MTSDQLPHDALVSVAKAIDSQGNYLARLLVRMLDRGFPRNDPPWVEVIRASDAVKVVPAGGGGVGTAQTPASLRGALPAGHSIQEANRQPRAG